VLESQPPQLATMLLDKHRKPPLIWRVLPPLLSISRVTAAPLIARDDQTSGTGTTSGSGDEAPNIVSNFQDLGAVLSLLAADTVEKKLSDPKAADWERMSTTWSLFGIIGAVRAHLKVAAGISGAERAGVDLCGAGVYTSKQTNGAMSVLKIGSPTLERWWQNDEGQMLGELELKNSPWIRPHVVAMGYSQCPFKGRKAVAEVVRQLLWTFTTVAVTCTPAILFRGSSSGILVNFTIVSLAVSGLIAGCLLPLLMKICNPKGVAHFSQLSTARFPDPYKNLLQDMILESQGEDPISRDSDPIAMFEDGDRVITPDGGTCRIFWQEPNAPTFRSGDLILIRLLAAFGTCTILVGYLCNYLELGKASSRISYAWLGVQVGILFIRYCLWATRPPILEGGTVGLAFIATGSLVQYSIEPESTDTSGFVQKEVVSFAIASAVSKAINTGESIATLDYPTLSSLAGAIPPDILRTGFLDLKTVFGCAPEVQPRKPPVSTLSIPQLRQTPSSSTSQTAEEIPLTELAHPDELRAIRLPWSFLEEYYTAQGLILGHLQWPVSDIYLAAAFRKETYLGLVTIRPMQRQDYSPDDMFATTSEGFAVCGDPLNCTIRPVKGGLMDTHYHNIIRTKIRDGRESAVANGPAHCELHARHLRIGSSTGEHITLTMPSLFEVMTQWGAQAVDHHKNKDHSKCGKACSIFSAENGVVF
ncbi:hypothetical protein FRB99_002555, partial [Tulasnella sp. 403]